MLAAEPLTAQHVRSDFGCGHPELDRWLIDHAISARGQGTRTYVLVDSPEKRVLGYFAIAPHLMKRDELARSAGRGAPRLIPAVLLGKLALHVELQGTGLGSELLILALKRITHAARSAGGKLVVVDAIDDRAAAFYRHHGFSRIPGNERRLVLKLSAIARELGLEWP